MPINPLGRYDLPDEAAGPRGMGDAGFRSKYDNTYNPEEKDLESGINAPEKERNTKNLKGGGVAGIESIGNSLTEENADPELLSQFKEYLSEIYGVNSIEELQLLNCTDTPVDSSRVQEEFAAWMNDGEIIEPIFGTHGDVQTSGKLELYFNPNETRFDYAKLTELWADPETEIRYTAGGNFQEDIITFQKGDKIVVVLATEITGCLRQAASNYQRRNTNAPYRLLNAESRDFFLPRPLNKTMEKKFVRFMYGLRLESEDLESTNLYIRKAKEITKIDVPSRENDVRITSKSPGLPGEPSKEIAEEPAQVSHVHTQEALIDEPENLAEVEEVPNQEEPEPEPAAILTPEPETQESQKKPTAIPVTINPETSSKDPKVKQALEQLPIVWAEHSSEPLKVTIKTKSDGEPSKIVFSVNGTEVTVPAKFFTESINGNNGHESAFAIPKGAKEIDLQKLFASMAINGTQRSGPVSVEITSL